MDIKVLKSLALFRGINEDMINKMLAEVRLRKKHFDKKEVIHQQGQAYSSLYIVVKGYCQGEMSRSGGKVLKVEEFHAPNAIAPGILYAPRNLLPVSLVAVNPVDILVIPREDVFHFWMKNEIFLKNFMEDISEKIFLLSHRLEILSFTTIKGKIAQYLLSQKKSRFVLQSSMDDLAQFLGVTRPSLSRSMSELVEEGIIQKESKIITILDHSALDEMLF